MYKKKFIPYIIIIILIASIGYVSDQRKIKREKIQIIDAKLNLWTDSLNSEIMNSPTLFNDTLPDTISAMMNYLIYENGLKAFEDNNYKKAKCYFAYCIRHFDDTLYLPKSYYWFGECQYALAYYTSAIAAFKVVADRLFSDRADDAQLKIGLCYLKLGMQEQAKRELKVLIDKYPNSECSLRGTRYLKEL